MIQIKKDGPYDARQAVFLYFRAQILIWRQEAGGNWCSKAYCMPGPEWFAGRAIEPI